jgi:hypothetical protein
MDPDPQELSHFILFIGRMGRGNGFFSRNLLTVPSFFVSIRKRTKFLDWYWPCNSPGKEPPSGS